MIYLLEDDDSIRKLVIYALQSQGYEAAGFERPSEFWHAMGRRLPELVLLDVMLPEEDGLSVLKKLRSATATAAIPVIMLTAKNTEFDRVTGLDCGAHTPGLWGGNNYPLIRYSWICLADLVRFTGKSLVGGEIMLV